VFPSKSYDAIGATGALAVGEVSSIFKIQPTEEADATALNMFQVTEPSRTQRKGEAPAELALLWLRRSVALPTNEWIGLIDANMLRAMS
jgi:hypothetical protein